MAIPAWRKYGKGQLYSERNGTTRRKESLCIFPISAGEESSVEDHLERISEFVSKQGPGLKKLADSCTMDVLIGCGSSNGQLGFVVTYSQMRQLSEHKLDCVLDMYSGIDEDT